LEPSDRLEQGSAIELRRSPAGRKVDLPVFTKVAVGQSELKVCYWPVSARAAESREDQVRNGPTCGPKLSLSRITVLARALSQFAVQRMGVGFRA